MLIRLWHLASLDAPTVAVVWSLGFASAAGTRLPAWVPLLLALGTWSVYLGDRLLDARAGLRNGTLRKLRERHLFHWRHRRILVPLAGCAGLTAAILIFALMPAGVRERDSVLAAAALAYFSGVHARRRPAWLSALFSKEFLVGLLFTAGCALPAFSQIHGIAKTGSLFWSLLAAAVFFAALAWLNCRAIDRWESAAHAETEALGCWLALFGSALAFAMAFIEMRGAALLLAGTASALLLAWLDRWRGRLTPLALRAAADLVLLTPLVLLTR